jgi:hypothetical protein
MDLKQYFESTSGKGYLSTANSGGEVNTAVYSRPHVLDDGTWVFGMADRLTHANLRENPYAVYAFNEKGFKGVRVYLKKVREEDTGPMLDQIKERTKVVSVEGAADLVKFAVYFQVLRTLPLVGT